MSIQDKPTTPDFLKKGPRHRLGWLLVAICLFTRNALAAYPDRFVWIFGWGLSDDGDVTNITRVLDDAARHGINGAVVSFGLDTLDRKDAAYFRRLKAVQQVCERDKLELIPAVFSVGYGSGILAHDPNLAEGLPVADAPFVVQGNEARFIPDPAARLVNGGFETNSGILVLSTAPAKSALPIPGSNTAAGRRCGWKTLTRTRMATPGPCKPCVSRRTAVIG
jgi:hypothetical protein